MSRSAGSDRDRQRWEGATHLVRSHVFVGERTPSPLIWLAALAYPPRRGWVEPAEKWAESRISPGRTRRKPKCPACERFDRECVGNSVAHRVDYLPAAQPVQRVLFCLDSFPLAHSLF